MADYDNEELAGAKRWWQKHGSAAVAGVVLGLVLLGGWYGWHWYQARQSAHAAGLYAQVQHGVSSDNVTGGVVNVVHTLENDYDGTPYAGAAALTLGAYYVDQKQLDKAATELGWASDHAANDGMKAIATVRLARVLWAQNKPDAALKQLDRDHPDAFDALFAELTGDIQQAQGNGKAAHAAYQKALNSLPQNVPRQPLSEKLQSTAAASSSADGAAPAAQTHSNATDPS